MATVTFSPAVPCAGGDHYTSEISLNGNPVATIVFSRADMRESISQEDRETAAKVIARVRAQGKTLNQVRNDMIAGFTVTI